MAWAGVGMGMAGVCVGVGGGGEEAGSGETRRLEENNKKRCGEYLMLLTHIDSLLIWQD